MSFQPQRLGKSRFQRERIIIIETKVDEIIDIVDMMNIHIILSPHIESMINGVGSSSKKGNIRIA